MNLLLDMHTFLWWVTDDPQLSATVRTLTADPSNTIYFSVVSAWEIVIKEQSGKLMLPESAATHIPSRLITHRFLTQAVELSHVLQIAPLSNHHRDPFDRLLIAQSQVEQIPFPDPQITKIQLAPAGQYTRPFAPAPDLFKKILGLEPVLK
jgi:PIN domain nuclease of toxin-antitoxin system